MGKVSWNEKEVIGVKKEEAGLPCRECNVFDECNAKGEKNRCGMWKAFDKLMFQYQKLDYFVQIDPLRRMECEDFKEHGEIFIKEYEKITGRKWMFRKDPYPEWPEPENMRKKQWEKEVVKMEKKKVLKCPECDEKIEELHNVQSGLKTWRFYINEKGETDYEQIEFNTDDEVNDWRCPNCDEVIAYSEGDAEKFLRGKKIQ